MVRVLLLEVGTLLWPVQDYLAAGDPVPIVTICALRYVFGVGLIGGIACHAFALWRRTSASDRTETARLMVSLNQLGAGCFAVWWGWFARWPFAAGTRCRP